MGESQKQSQLSGDMSYPDMHEKDHSQDTSHSDAEPYDTAAVLEKGTARHPDEIEALDRTTSKASSKIEPAPDGGLVAWTQVLMGHFVMFTTWGFINTFSVFETYYQTSLDRDVSSISWIGTFQLFLLFFLGTASGRALDAGLFRWVFGAGVVFQLVGVFMTSLSTQYYQIFLAQGVCTGVGMGLMFVPTISIVSTYFERKRALVLSIMLSGTATGGIIFPAIAQQLIPKVGFGWAVRVIGFVMLLLDVFAFAFLKPRLRPRKSGPLVEWQAFRDVPFVLFLLGMFFVFWSVYFAFFYIGTFARNVIVVPYTESINFLFVVNAVGAPGRLLPAYLADAKFGPLNMIVPMIVCASICFYTWTVVHDTTGLYIWVVFYGLFGAAVQGLWPAALAAFNKDPRKAGTRMGMGFTLLSFACLTGSPLGGALVQRDNGGYLYAQMWAGSCMFVGGCLVFAARITKTGRVLKVKA